MNKLGKILLGLIGVFALAIAAVFFFTADMVTSADEFFSAVRSKDMDKAYDYLSDDFRSSTSKTELENYLKAHSLDSFEEASWESRSVSGGRGSLTGSITTKTGGVVPISVSLVKGNSQWKIYSIQKPSSGIQEESVSAEIPSEKALVRLVSRSMQVFAESVNKKSMSDFRSHVSAFWQKQFTVERFDQAFESFYETGVDLTTLDGLAPQFSTKPSLDENGTLLVSGLYPTKPEQVHFEHKYLYEGIGWKLVGFSASIK